MFRNSSPDKLHRICPWKRGLVLLLSRSWQRAWSSKLFVARPFRQRPADRQQCEKGEQRHSLHLSDGRGRNKHLSSLHSKGGLWVWKHIMYLLCLFHSSPFIFFSSGSFLFICAVPSRMIPPSLFLCLFVCITVSLLVLFRYFHFEWRWSVPSEVFLQAR